MYKHSTRFNKLVLVVSLILLVTAVSTYAFLRYWYHSPVKDSGPYFVEGMVRTVAETDSIESSVTGSRNSAIVQAVRKAGASVVIEREKELWQARLIASKN